MKTATPMNKRAFMLQTTFRKRVLLLFTALLLAATAMQAQTYFTVDGLRYYVNAGNNTATVYAENSSISGDITIPSTVMNGDVTYTVTGIGEFAFTYCSGLTSVTIADGVTSIAERAFGDCSSLTSITIPESVTNTGGAVFYMCSSLVSVTIPDGVTSIGNWFFWGCSSLASVTIPESVTSIGSEAFYGCSGLTSVIIPENVTSIGNEAFLSCRGLTSVTIPESVRSIGRRAFGGCTGLTGITVASGNPSYSSEAGVLFDKNKATILQYPEGKADNRYVIPGSVTSIGESAFFYCNVLTSVTIPEGVKNIGENAFYGCSGLTSVTIPDGVTSIDEYAFDRCTGLTSVTISESVTSIGDYAFESCTGLQSFEVKWAEPLAVSPAVFDDIDLNMIELIVPAGTKDKYQRASVWRDFREINSTSTLGAPAANTLRAYAGGGMLHVSGLTPGERFYVYDMQGRQIYADRAANGAQTLSLPSPGLYIVTAGRQSIKVSYRIAR